MKASNEEILIIHIPADISRKDLERMKAEIRAVTDQAELRGEQKVLAWIAAQGGG